MELFSLSLLVIVVIIFGRSFRFSLSLFLGHRLAETSVVVEKRVGWEMVEMV